jgi:hypothetical protein
MVDRCVAENPVIPLGDPDLIIDDDASHVRFRIFQSGIMNDALYAKSFRQVAAKMACF